MRCQLRHAPRGSHWATPHRLLATGAGSQIRRRPRNRVRGRRNKPGGARYHEQAPGHHRVGIAAGRRVPPGRRRCDPGGPGWRQVDSGAQVGGGARSTAAARPPGEPQVPPGAGGGGLVDFYDKFAIKLRNTGEPRTKAPRSRRKVLRLKVTLVRQLGSSGALQALRRYEEGAVWHRSTEVPARRAARAVDLRPARRSRRPQRGRALGERPDHGQRQPVSYRHHGRAHDRVLEVRPPTRRAQWSTGATCLAGGYVLGARPHGSLAHSHCLTSKGLESMAGCGREAPLSALTPPSARPALTDRRPFDQHMDSHLGHLTK